jgi:hypothetical protein
MPDRNPTAEVNVLACDVNNELMLKVGYLGTARLAINYLRHRLRFVHQRLERHPEYSRD